MNLAGIALSPVFWKMPWRSTGEPAEGRGQRTEASPVHRAREWNVRLREASSPTKLAGFNESDDNVGAAGMA